MPFTARDPARSKRAIYEIVDPCVAFWHAEIAPLVRAGSIGLAEPARLWTEVVAPRVPQHMGRVFEQICHEWLACRSPAPLRLGRWRNARSGDEVDLVALLASGELLLGACEWGGVDGSDLGTLRRRAAKVAAELDHEGPVRLALFTGSGAAAPDVRELAGEGAIDLVGPEELTRSS